MIRKSIGIKKCENCGSFYRTDLRGGSKWCFPCKAVLYREYRKRYQRIASRVKPEREYAAR